MIDDNEPDLEFDGWMDKLINQKYLLLKIIPDAMIDLNPYVYSREVAHAIKNGKNIKSYIQGLPLRDLEIILKDMLSSGEEMIAYKHSFVLTILALEKYYLVTKNPDSLEIKREHVDHLISCVILFRLEILRRSGKVKDEDMQYTLFPIESKIRELMDSINDDILNIKNDDELNSKS